MYSMTIHPCPPHHSCRTVSLINCLNTPFCWLNVSKYCKIIPPPPHTLYVYVCMVHINDSCTFLQVIPDNVIAPRLLYVLKVLSMAITSHYNMSTWD